MIIRYKNWFSYLSRKEYPRYLFPVARNDAERFLPLEKRASPWWNDSTVYLEVKDSLSALCQADFSEGY